MAALATYREALAIDADWPAAHAGVAEVNRMLRDAEYERLLSAGFGLLGAEDFAAAQREFEAALAMRPGSREAADGLAQAEEGAKLDQIALAEARGARIRAARALGSSDRAVSLRARERRHVAVRADGARASSSPRGSRRQARQSDRQSDAAVRRRRARRRARAARHGGGRSREGAASHVADREARRARRARVEADPGAPRIGSADERHVVSRRRARRVRRQGSRAAPGHVHRHRQPRRLSRRAPDVHRAPGPELSRRSDVVCVEPI